MCSDPKETPAGDLKDLLLHLNSLTEKLKQQLSPEAKIATAIQPKVRREQKITLVGDPQSWCPAGNIGPSIPFCSGGQIYLLDPPTSAATLMYDPDTNTYYWSLI